MYVHVVTLSLRSFSLVPLSAIYCCSDYCYKEGLCDLLLLTSYSHNDTFFFKTQRPATIAT